jgi:LacI family transcriptional regulator
VRSRDATIQQVAARAGVSIATVSRVANGTGQVSPSMRATVSEAIAELGFRPSHAGRALVSRRHGAVGVVLPGLSGPYHSEVIAGFEQAAVEARLAVLILGTHLLEGSGERVLDLASRVDGLVVLGGSVVDDSVVDRLVDRGFPVVLMAGPPHPRVTSVRVESRDAVRRLTRHLVEGHGHTDLAFLGNPTGSPDTAERFAGYQQGRAELGLAADDAPVHCGHDQAGGLEAAANVLSLDAPPRAVVCANDEIALGVLVYAFGHGVRVPDDLAITGFDSLPASAMTRPGITSVWQPMRDLGRRTLDELRAVIDAAPPPHDVVIPTEVVLRESCGCPPPTPAG